MAMSSLNIDRIDQLAGLGVVSCPDTKRQVNVNTDIVLLLVGLDKDVAGLSTYEGVSGQLTFT